MESDSIHQEIFARVFGNRKRGLSIRMVPMIDMIFLLLIFFLVAAKFRPEEDFLPLQMPAAAGEQQRTGKPEPLVIDNSPMRLGYGQALPICSSRKKPCLTNAPGTGGRRNFTSFTAGRGCLKRKPVRFCIRLKFWRTVTIIYRRCGRKN